MKLYNAMLDLEKEGLGFPHVTGLSFVFFSLFSLLSKKHNKVLEQATQSLRCPPSSSDVRFPDYVSSCLTIAAHVSAC